MLRTAAAAPHQFLDTAKTHLCTRPPCTKAEMAHQHPFQTLLPRTFPHRSNRHIHHAATEVRRNDRRDLTLRRCHRPSRQAKLLRRKNYAKRRGSRYVGMKTK